MTGVWVTYALLSLLVGYFAARTEYKDHGKLGSALAAWFTLTVLWPFLLLVVGLLTFIEHANDHGWNKTAGRILFGKR